jgi:hypothetical protein
LAPLKQGVKEISSWSAFPLGEEKGLLSKDLLKKFKNGRIKEIFISLPELKRIACMVHEIYGIEIQQR